MRHLLLLLPISVLAATGPVTLPVEVVGRDGTTASVAVDVPEAQASGIRSLWMQIHNLNYPDMVSVQVNDGSWMSLNNGTVTVAEPGRSYGGIGGGFATLKMNLALPAGAVRGGVATVRFRFNHSDGLASGFRILAFNFVQADGSMALPPTAFVQDEPAAWTPPSRKAADIAGGRQLWYSAQLAANNRPGAAQIHAHCSDCHAQDGRDLKYFNFSNASIEARAEFHGLSAVEGEQVASYIRSLPVPNPGRPWNPPYQPGPGLDSRPVGNWAAGAGLSWALENDADSLPYLFSGPQRFAGSPQLGPLSITPDTFRPDGNLNPREIPIALQLPDWNHWLPRVHPKDAWGADFVQSELSRFYEGTGADGGLRERFGSSQLAKLISTGETVNLFDRWTKSERKFLAKYEGRSSGDWSPDLTNRIYSTQLWQLTKAWELEEEFQLEGRGREFYGPSGESRTWFNTSPLEAAPAEASIPDGPNGMGGSALTNEYFDNAWYEVQLLVNGGNHRHHGRQPVDWVYNIARFLDMYRESHRPEPARLLVTAIKALQWSDPKSGPENQLRGWRPDATVGPTIMVDNDWSPVFGGLQPDVRRAVTDAFLAAWLEKNLKYRTAQFFTQGTTGHNYTPPQKIADITGASVWTAAPKFEAAGVAPSTVAQLVKWGHAYTNMAASLHY